MAPARGPGPAMTGTPHFSKCAVTSASGVAVMKHKSADPGVGLSATRPGMLLAGCRLIFCRPKRSAVRPRQSAQPPSPARACRTRRCGQCRQRSEPDDRADRFALLNSGFQGVRDCHDNARATSRPRQQAKSRILVKLQPEIMSHFAFCAICSGSAANSLFGCNAFASNKSHRTFHVPGAQAEYA